MHIELKPLRCFLALAEELNFSRAALRLHMTQPALSSQIRTLEQQLGFPLFDRTTRRVDLTASGAEFLVHARRLVAESARLSEVSKSLRDGKLRRMRLGAAFYTIDIPERVGLLEGYFANHPDVPLEVSPAWQHSLVADLQGGGIDVALLLGVPISRSDYAAERDRQPAVEIVFPDDLPRLVLRRERAGLLVPRELPLAALDPIPGTALAGIKVATLGPIHGEKVTSPIRRLLDDAGASAIVPPEPHSVAVERYGRQFRLPAVTLGWFGAGGPDDRNMVRRSVEGLDLLTEFSVVRSPISTNPALARFWEEVQAHALPESGQAQLDRNA